MASNYVKSVEKITDQDTAESILPSSPLGQEIIEELNDIIFYESSRCLKCIADGRNEDEDIEDKIRRILEEKYGDEASDWDI